MDKNKKKNKLKRKKDNKSISNKIAQLRGWIQAAATLLTNIHISNIFKKIDVSDRTQAAVFAIKNDIITLK